MPKLTVHFGTDQNIENDIFAEYKHTLNELPVKKSFLQYVCEIWRTRVFTGSKSLTKRRISWTMFWRKLRQYKGSILPLFLTSCRQIWQVDKIIAEDVNRAGEFWNSAPSYFYDSDRAGLYAANEGFSSNACRKLMTRKVKNLQHGIRAQMVLKLTNKLQMAEIETDSRIDV